MKKDIANYWPLHIVIVLTLIISSCEKNNADDHKKFLGTWISIDLTDTLDFASEHDFYKMFSGVRDHFDYSLSKDSITIGYNGMLYILVKPSTHFCKLNGNELTIDFRPQCYGFRAQEIKFFRK